MRSFMQNNPDPHLPPIERSDYVFHLQGNLAWVYFKNQEGQETAGQHQRVLRKENGLWKMINSVWPKTHKALIMNKKALENAMNFE